MERARRSPYGLAGCFNMPCLPLITVVTPSLNQGGFLERTIQSVLLQNYPSLEYIVVDGGSTDQSVEIIKRYTGRLRWWCSEPDHGQADAIEKGFSHANGEVLCWLNSDDVFLPGALHAVGEYFRDNPHVEVVNGAAFCIDASDVPIRRLFQSTCTLGIPASAQRLRIYGQDGIYQPATFWRRSAHFAVGGLRRELQFAMDLDLFVRLAERQPFQVLRRYLACFRIHAESKSKTIQRVREAEVERLRIEYETPPISLFPDPLYYGWFRMTSLARKTLLHVRYIAGLERFPPVPEFSAHFPANLDAEI